MATDSFYQVRCAITGQHGRWSKDSQKTKIHRKEHVHIWALAHILLYISYCLEALYYSDNVSQKSEIEPSTASLNLNSMFCKCILKPREAKSKGLIHEVL